MDNLFLADVEESTGSVDERHQALRVVEKSSPGERGHRLGDDDDAGIGGENADLVRLLACTEEKCASSVPSPVLHARTDSGQNPYPCIQFAQLVKLPSLGTVPVILPNERTEYVAVGLVEGVKNAGTPKHLPQLHLWSVGAAAVAVDAPRY